MHRILVIDDDAMLRQLLAEALTRAGYAVACAENGRAGLAHFDSFLPQMVVTDLDMPEIDGLAVIETLRRRHAQEPWILAISGGGPLDERWDLLEMARRLGANETLLKPFRLKEFMLVVAAAIGARDSE